MDGRLESGRSWTLTLFAAVLCIPLCLAALIITPAQWGLLVFVLSACLLAIALWRVPMLGVYLITMLYPIGSVSIIVRGHTPYEVMLYGIELLAVPILVVRVLRLLSEHWRRVELGGRGLRHSTAWAGLCVLLLLGSSAVAAARSESPVMSAYGLWRLVTIVVIVDYIVAQVDSMAKLVRVLYLYCLVGFLLAAAAVTATHYALSVRIPLFECLGASVFWQFALFNMPSDFLAVLVGETTGYGLCAKHDLSLFMFAGVLIALCLCLSTRNGRIRAGLLGLVLCFEAMVYQARSKLSIIGGLFVVALFSIIVAPWRRRVAAILAVFVGLNVVGAVSARLLAPAHGKKQDSAITGIQSATSASEYEPSSLAGRRMIWRRTLKRVRRERGMGCGPDSLGKEFAFGIPHGHNLFLTVLAESGAIAALSLLAILAMVVTRTSRFLAAGSDPTNPLWLLRVTLAACTLFTLFEYQFDMPVYRPHLWYMLGLLLASLSIGQPMALPADE